MDLLLGIDIGTNATKTLLINSDGEILALAQRDYDVMSSSNGWIEQESEDWWRAVVETVREVIKENYKFKNYIRGISFSTQGGTLIPVDSRGRPLRRAITWLDQRADKEGRKVIEELGSDFFYNITGHKVRQGLPLLQICWLKNNERKIFEKTYKFLFVNDYIIHKLTDSYYTDPSNSSITMLYNLRTGKWDPQLLKITGILPAKLSNIKSSGVPVGRLTSAATNQLGLSREVVVSSGGHDQYCASLGAGAFHSGDCLLSCGSAWVLLFTLDEPIFDPDVNLTPGRHVIRNRWGEMAAISSGGVVLEWFKNGFGKVQNSRKDREIYELFDRKAKDIPAGSNNLLFFPHFIGSTAPTYQPAAKGALIGLTLSHNKYDIFKSIMEALGFETLWNIKSVEKLGIRLEKIKMIGGATKSSIWPQIIADITGKKIIIPSLTEAACVGAAILAGIGVGVFKNCEDGFRKLGIKEREISPSRNNEGKYKKLFAVYQETFWKLQGFYKAIGET